MLERMAMIAITTSNSIKVKPFRNTFISSFDSARKVNHKCASLKRESRLCAITHVSQRTLGPESNPDLHLVRSDDARDLLQSGLAANDALQAKLPERMHALAGSNLLQRSRRELLQDRVADHFIHD